ncbi:MAG TPA: hypothetical protein V6C99_08960 [Oculatellaceae cyanobacterium]|jgi:hypothetical protein
MFGLYAGKTRNSNTGASSAEVGKKNPTPVFTLISQENIYRPRNPELAGHARKPVLLLKKGMEITANLLPKLVRNGADPAQFLIKSDDGKLTPASFMSSPLSDTNLQTDAPTSLVRAIRSKKRVVLLDPDTKSLKRLTDCLFTCGFGLDNLYPVRMASGLSWALQKYAPHLLIVEYLLPGKQENGLQALRELASVLPFLEQVILVAPPLQSLSDEESWEIQAFCRQWNVKTLSKPVNRFALKQILDQGIRELPPPRQASD